MAAGKLSSIPVVKTVDVRDINNALNAVRECIRVLSDALNAVGSQANQTTFNASQGNANIAALQAQIAALQAQVDALTASINGSTTVYRADAVISVFDTVYPTSDGGVSPVDTEDPTAVFSMLGVAITSAAIGVPVTVRWSGVVTITGSAFDAGRAVYAQVGGGVTQYPSYASVAIPIGVAISATSFWVSPQYPALRTDVFDPGYQDFIPATLGLVHQLIDQIVTSSRLVIYDEEGRALLTEDGLELFTED
jgi:hypothetical protein